MEANALMRTLKAQPPPYPVSLTLFLYVDFNWHIELSISFTPKASLLWDAGSFERWS